MKEKRGCVMGERLARAIITIIVLTSISGGCAEMQPPKNPPPYDPRNRLSLTSATATAVCKDEAAAIIISPDWLLWSGFTDPENDACTDEDAKAIMNRKRVGQLFFTHLDNSAISAIFNHRPVAIEMPPGIHTVRFRAITSIPGRET